MPNKANEATAPPVVVVPRMRGPLVVSMIPIKGIRPSPFNPRKRFDPDALEELAESIRANGILEPLILRAYEPPAGRPRVQPETGRAKTHEIVVGERRYRAAKLAGLTELPALVRELSDAEALEIQIVENLQRVDIHPLEEADGYTALLAHNGAYTPESVALLVGKSLTHIRTRLQFATLEPAPREAFTTDRLTAGHAIELARLAPEDQARALEATFDTMLRDVDSDPAAMSVRELRRWVAEYVRLDLVAAAEQPDQFPELVEELATVAALVPVSDIWGTARRMKKPDVAGAPLAPSQWKRVPKKQRCRFITRGVVVLGDPDERGKVLDICCTPECTKHFPENVRDFTPASPALKASRAAQKRTADRWTVEQKLWGSTVRRQVALELEEATKDLTLTDKMAGLIFAELMGAGSAVRRKRNVGPLTAGTFARAAVLELLHRRSAFYGPHNATQIRAFLKPFGVDLAAIMRRAKNPPKVKGGGTRTAARGTRKR